MRCSFDFHLEKQAPATELLDDDDDDEDVVVAVGCCKGMILTGRVEVGMEDPSWKSEELGDA